MLAFVAIRRKKKQETISGAQILNLISITMLICILWDVKNCLLTWIKSCVYFDMQLCKGLIESWCLERNLIGNKAQYLLPLHTITSFSNQLLCHHCILTNWKQITKSKIWGEKSGLGNKIEDETKIMGWNLGIDNYFQFLVNPEIIKLSFFFKLRLTWLICLF